MLQLKGGDDLALNEVKTRWQQPLVAFIHRYIGSEADALDLAQEIQRTEISSRPVLM